MSVRPHVRQVHVAADVPSTNQLSDRLRAVLEVGTRLDQQVEPGMETEAGGPMRRSNNKRANRAGERNDLREEEERLRAREAAVAEKEARLAALERANPQPRLPKAQEKRPVGPPQSQEVPRRRPSPGRVRPDRPTLGVDRDFDVPDEPEARLTGEEIERAAKDGRTYVQALRDDGVDVDRIRIMMSDIVELTEYVKDDTIKNDCIGSSENMRRGDVLFAVEAVRTKLNLLEWPLHALGLERYEDLCAFEAIIFLASPAALVQSCLSMGRAKLREQWGQRELCGWLDTVLLCVRPMEIRPRIVSGLFLTSCNRSHLDIIGQSGYAALGNNISQAFSNAITLSKMYMFVEELLLANSYSGAALKAMKAEFEKRNYPVCVQIEQDGALGYVWAAMLHHLVTGSDIDSTVGFNVSDGGPARYKKYMVGGNATGDYIWNVYTLAKNAWWVDTLLLTTTLNLINEENAREYHNASTYSRLTASTNVRSCLSVAEAERLFAFSKTSSAMKIVWAKTWAVTVCASSAIATASGTAIRTASTVTYYTSLAAASAATIFGAAPITTTVVGTGLGVAALKKINDWSPSLAEYLKRTSADVATASAQATADAAAAAASAAGSAAAAAARATAEAAANSAAQAAAAAAEAASATEAAARESVRSGAGYAAQSATAQVNAAAAAAATMFGGNASSVPQFDPQQMRAAVQNATDGNEGLRKIPANGLAIGGRLHRRYNPMARPFAGGAGPGGAQ